MAWLHFKLLFMTLYVTHAAPKMMRNDALISKMVSDFQKDNTLAEQASRGNVQHQQQQQQQQEVEQPKNVLTLMQSVLCKNFPSIPCDMIVEDETLKTLIERSIQQLKYKKLSMDKTTPLPDYHLTLFPIVNSEDLSNFLQVNDNGYYSEGKTEKRGHKHRRRIHKNNIEEGEGKKRSSKKDSQRTALYSSHKNMRKFYPHKIKYKDKAGKASRDNYRDYSEEKMSMSVEGPDVNLARKRVGGNYKGEPSDPPVWRIDYMKHGEPSMNMFGYESDRLKEKLIKSGPTVMVADEFLEKVSRKDVLHPDVYIKKNFIRKNALDMNSGALD
ncbi:uncharacterized protein LOC142983248 [Anticarsia gemmatalis]|uniref:uncharacterized protein LOC142983248 n=1 Tax=Anticarsia gemmatalis TaxID=129554 RepID=UPI003F765999